MKDRAYGVGFVPTLVEAAPVRRRERWPDQRSSTEAQRELDERRSFTAHGLIESVTSDRRRTTIERETIIIDTEPRHS